jgi:molybdopterin molybdotransferase
MASGGGSRHSVGGGPAVGVEEAVRLILERVHPLEVESVPLPDALGRVLGEDVTSRDDLPPFDNSAMDGFAVRAQDTRGAAPDSPVELALVGESRAGRPAERGPGAGEAVRISTGAVLPAGADAVVRVEDTAERNGVVAVQAEVGPGKEIRRAGEDVHAGETVLRAGRGLGAAELAVAASVGAGALRCSCRPRVSILVTGDELIDPGLPLADGQIRNTNGFAIEAQVRAAGGTPTARETVGDDYRATVAAIESALGADVVVTTGGVSVGPHDHVKPALAELGVEEVFWGVALRPGRPTWFGSFSKPGTSARRSSGPVLVFGLPGNPVSAMITFHLFVRPALAALQGATLTATRAFAVIDDDYTKQPGRAHVLRCRLEARDDGWHVRPTKAQGSHVLTSMLDADALAYLEAERGDVHAGDRVQIEIL